MGRESVWCARGLLLFVAILLMAPVMVQAEMSAAGCKTEHYMLKELAAAYKQKTGNDVSLGRTGNIEAVGMLLEKKIDFAFTCKPISDLAKKFKLDAQAVANWESVPIGKDPILVASNYINGVDNLTIEQLTRIFRGDVKNWKELGGSDLPVTVGYLNSNIESGVVLLFKELTVGKDGKLDPLGVKLEEPAKIGQFVINTPGGIAFVSHNSFIGDHKHVIRIDGFEPTSNNIQNGSYPLVATYYLTAPVQKNAMVADFIGLQPFAGGAEGCVEKFHSLLAGRSQVMRSNR